MVRGPSELTWINNDRLDQTPRDLLPSPVRGLSIFNNLNHDILARRALIRTLVVIRLCALPRRGSKVSINEGATGYGQQAA